MSVTPNEGTPEMTLDHLIEQMKSGKPYIVPNERFILELKEIKIKNNYKIQYRVISASESDPLDGQNVVSLLHEMFPTVKMMISYWIRRGLNKDAKEFVDFELVVQRLSASPVHPDQEALPFPDEDIIDGVDGVEIDG